MSRLTFAEGDDVTPVWSPDGAFVAFASNRDSARPELYRKPADGSGEAERLSVSEDVQLPSDWSPDGKHLAFSRFGRTSGVYVLDVHGDREPTAFVETPFDESDASFSSDGRFLAYMSDESGRYEIYVQPYPGPGAKTQVSTEGGQFPIWNPADRELFYQVEAERDGDVRLMAVQYGIDGDQFLPEKPSELFRSPFAMGPRAEYDVSPDGERTPCSCSVFITRICSMSIIVVMSMSTNRLRNAPRSGRPYWPSSQVLRHQSKREHTITNTRAELGTWAKRMSDEAGDKKYLAGLHKVSSAAGSP